MHLGRHCRTFLRYCTFCRIAMVQTSRWRSKGHQTLIARCSAPRCSPAAAQCRYFLHKGAHGSFKCLKKWRIEWDGESELRLCGRMSGQKWNDAHQAVTESQDALAYMVWLLNSTEQLIPNSLQVFILDGRVLWVISLHVNVSDSVC